MSPHEILGIHPYSGKPQVKEAFAKLAKLYHPDVYNGDKKYANDKFREILVAYKAMLATAPDNEYVPSDRPDQTIFRVVSSRWNSRLKIYEVSIDVPGVIAEEGTIAKIMFHNEDEHHIAETIELVIPSGTKKNFNVLFKAWNNPNLRVRVNILPKYKGVF